MSELQLAQVIDELKASRKELKQIRMILEDIYNLNKEASEMAHKQAAFSNTAMMDLQKSMGENPTLQKMFQDLALGKEDKTDV